MIETVLAGLPWAAFWVVVVTGLFCSWAFFQDLKDKNPRMAVVCVLAILFFYMLAMAAILGTFQKALAQTTSTVTATITVMPYGRADGQEAVINGQQVYSPSGCYIDGRACEDLIVNYQGETR